MSIRFEDFGLSNELLNALSKKGFEEPSEIQRIVVPELLKERTHLIGQAQTGTGKTAAFGIPILETIDADWVDAEILESKRKGFVEFTGTLKGKLANGSVFYVTSLKVEPSAGTIAIFNSENRCIIQESGTPAIYQMKKSDGFKQNIIPFEMEFQSSLTTKILEELLSGGGCNLPTYEEAKQTHELFIKALLKPYNMLQNTVNHILPIT